MRPADADTGPVTGPAIPGLVYGRHPVLEALQAGEPLTEVMLADGVTVRDALARIVTRARDRGVPVKHVPRAALDRVLGHHDINHQGVVARISDFAYADPAEILAVGIRRAEAAFILVLDAVQDVHNLGNLLRSAEAAGVHGVVLADREAAGVTSAVRKASAGAVAHLPVARGDLVAIIDQLRERGIHVVGLDATAALPYDSPDARLAGPVALVVGGEARGLRTAIANRCDVLVRLPMRGQVASLNAGVAGSIVLYEAIRQRAAAGG